MSYSSFFGILFKDFLKISDEFVLFCLSVLISFLINRFLIMYIEKKSSQIRLLNNIAFAKNFIYLNISILLFISGLFWSPFSKEAFILSEISTYFLSLWIAKYIDNFFNNTTNFFKITTIMGMFFILQNMEIFNNIYNYINNLRVNLLFVQLEILSVTKLFTYIYLLYYINKAIKIIFVEKFDFGLTNHQRIMYRIIIQYAFYGISTLMLLFGIGLKTNHLVMIISSVGIGVGIGIQKLFANIISGFIVLYEQKFKIGDLIYIKSEDLWGYIRRMNLRTIVVENFANEFIVIPNEMLLNNAIKNMDMNHKKSREKITFTVSHDADLKTAITKAKIITERSKYITSSICRVEEIDAHGFTIALYLHVNDYDDPEKDIWTLKSEVIIDLQRELKEFNIKFAVQKVELLK